MPAQQRIDRREYLALLDERARRDKQRTAEREQREFELNLEQIRKRCSTLAGFVREAWHVLEPEAKYVHNWHIDAICKHLEAVSEGRINRLLINVPPGSSKSLIVSVMWPAWEWGPCGRRSLRYLATAFNEGPVKRDTRKSRDLIASEWYRRLWPEVVLTRTAETSFANSSTGTREGVPFGSLTSQRGDRLIIDDPHSTETAESDTERMNTARKFREGAVNRLNDQERSAIVVIMQRLHEEDISGVIISLGMEYVHLMLPMEFDPARGCETAIGFKDPRTDDSQLLDPIRFPRETVAALERDMGSYAYCTPAESPVLMGDLSLKPIGEVKVGDTVCGFTAHTREKGKRTHLLHAEIKAISRSVRPVVKVTLDTGRTIRCTEDHQWWTGRSAEGSHKPFMPAVVGRKLLRVCEPDMPAIDPPMVRDAGWLAGFFDADGSVSLMQRHEGYRANSLIQFTQGSGRNLPMCNKLERVLTALGFEYGYSEREPEGRAHCGNYKMRQYYVKRGHGGITTYQRFLHLVQPEKWRERIVSGALGTKFVSGKERVVSIEPDGVEEVFGLTTTTGTYVVWGLASSNSGQYQQSPTPRSGGMFQRGDFEIVEAVPAGGRRVRAWDFAASKEKPGKQPDWTVGLRMLLVRDTFYVEDVMRGRWSASDVETRLKNTASQDGQMVTVRMPQDPGAAGKADAETKVKLLKGYPVVTQPITGDKATRARPASAQAEAGNVKLLRGPWNDAFLSEVCSFPNAAFDDQVDAFADALNELALGSAYNWDNV